MSRLKRKYQTMRLWWSLWKTSFIIPSILTMHALQVKQRKPQAWEKHCQKGISRIPIVRTSVIFGETGDSSFTIYCPKSESRWAVDGTNTEIGYGSTLLPMFFWRILCPAFLNIFVAVHGFRVAFLLKPDGINESHWISQSNYSAILRMNQPAVPWICFFNPKSQPKFRVDVSTVEICIKPWTSEPWTFEPID